MLLRDEQTGQLLPTYTPEQVDFLREVYPEYGYLETTKLFNERFNENKTAEQIRKKARYEGLKYIRGREQWPAEHNEYLKEIYAGRKLDEITEMMNEKFGTHRSVHSVRTQACHLGIKTGYVPENFKLGQSNPYKEQCPIGTISHIEKVKGIPLPIIKVNDEIGSDKKGKNWDLLKNYVWKQHYGEIPENHFIAVADGNEENCDISNLRCIPYRYMQSLCRLNKWYRKGAEILDAGIAWCDLHFTLKDMEEGK